jgi:uncharacterized short protein YbdD (DUF466 family)
MPESPQAAPKGPSVADRRTALSRIQRFACMLRRLAGMPDYQAYVEHLRLHHPESPVPSEREFFTLYTESRYAAGPTRCC